MFDCIKKCMASPSTGFDTESRTWILPFFTNILFENTSVKVKLQTFRMRRNEMTIQTGSLILGNIMMIFIMLGIVFRACLI